ncbi:sugar ABC transporter permease [Pontivivens ytuae]|uniref:Sugar ABC transporter permease n=2 Tax=Pontivivens ytuae TaxID=2789856 RepID=A0A7S9LVW9_9RHOB|nr:sugar ABC transporter permease [Pontivivens ytuae]
MFASTRPRRSARGLSGYLFIAPALALACCLIVLPLVAVLFFSLTDYTLAAVEFSFVGFQNYASAFTEPGLRVALTNTLLYVGVVVPCAVALGLLIALLVHERGRSRRFYEIAFFLPVTGTMVAMAVVWQYLLHGRIGPLNAVLSGLGFERVDFLTDPDAALYAIAAIGIWQLTGFAMVLFLAGLTAIPRDIYEAASVDGADGGFDRFWRITLPLLGPTMLFVTITCSITAFQVFDTVAVLTRGGPMKSTEVLLYTVYLEGFQYFEIGRASALITLFLAFILLFSLLQIFVAERRTFYGG